MQYHGIFVFVKTEQEMFLQQHMLQVTRVYSKSDKHMRHYSSLGTPWYFTVDFRCIRRVCRQCIFIFSEEYSQWSDELMEDNLNGNSRCVQSHISLFYRYGRIITLLYICSHNSIQLWLYTIYKWIIGSVFRNIFILILSFRITLIVLMKIRSDLPMRCD